MSKLNRFSHKRKAKLSGKLIKKLSVPALSVSLALSLFSCGGDVVEDVVESLTNNDAEISYVNAVDQQLTFFAKNATSTKTVYNDEHDVVTLMTGEVSDEIKHKWLGLTKSEFGIENTNYRNERHSISEHLKNNHHYWLIAWQEVQEHQVTILEKSSSNSDGQYRVRVFANQRLDVYVDNNQNKTLTTDVGKISAWLTIAQCTGLTIGGNEIDLCQAGNMGKSYLAVVNQDGLISLAQE